MIDDSEIIDELLYCGDSSRRVVRHIALGFTMELGPDVDFLDAKIALNRTAYERVQAGTYDLSHPDLNSQIEDVQHRSDDDVRTLLSDDDKNIVLVALFEFEKRALFDDGLYPIAHSDVGMRKRLAVSLLKRLSGGGQ